MNTKYVRLTANATEIEVTETDDINQEEQTDQKGTENESDAERPESRRKICKQTDVDEKDQSDESFDKMKLIKENLMLLSEIDKLKKSNRSMSQRIYYLETIVKPLPLKKS